jgi:hypothetical protein
MKTESAMAPSRQRRWWVVGLGLLALILVAVVGLWWWNNRPIRPVVLSPAEKAVVEQKVGMLQDPESPTPVNTTTQPPAEAPAEAPAGPAELTPEDPVYEKGSREILLTERELNGLLNDRTTLGETVKFQLARDAIHARIETDLPDDLPLVGGKRLKVRARFLVGGDPVGPSFVLDDVTVWGISLPSAWLGGLKGHNLLGDVLGTGGGSGAGIEQFRIEPGKLTILLAE